MVKINLGQDEHETAHGLLEMVKSNLGQDEHETDAKNWTSTNLNSQLPNHLEMVKKIFQVFESLNFEVRGRS